MVLFGVLAPPVPSLHCIIRTEEGSQNRSFLRPRDRLQFQAQAFRPTTVSRTAFRGLSGPLLGLPGPLFGGSWSSVGRSWGSLERSGSFLGLSGPLLGSFGRLLGPSGRLRGVGWLRGSLWVALGGLVAAPRALWGPSGRLFGLSWPLLGPSCILRRRDSRCVVS